MYGYTFAQALCRLSGDELRMTYVLCCDTAVQELLASKIREWIKRDPERFTRQLEEKTTAYRDWDDQELRLGIILELAKRARVQGMPLNLPAELEEFAGAIVERIERDLAENDREYAAYRTGQPELSELQALLDYQISSLTQVLGRLIDGSPEAQRQEYVRRIEELAPELAQKLSEFEDKEESALGQTDDSAAAESEFGDGEPAYSEAGERFVPAGSGPLTRPEPIEIGPLEELNESEAADLLSKETGPVRVKENDPQPGDRAADVYGGGPSGVDLHKKDAGASFPDEDEFDPEYPEYRARAQDVSASEPEEPDLFEAERRAEAAAEEAGVSGAGQGGKDSADRPETVYAASAPLLLAELERQDGLDYYQTAIELLGAAEGLFGLGEARRLSGRHVAFGAVLSGPAFLPVLPGGRAASLPRSLNPQRRQLPGLLLRLLLPELVSAEQEAADYKPLLELWQSYADRYAQLASEIRQEEGQMEYYAREASSCAEQLEAARGEREGSERRIVEIRESLVDKLRASSMQLPHISESFDRLLAEYSDNRQRMTDAEVGRRERGSGFAGLVKYTLNYAASGVTLIDLKRKQTRLLERMADEALHTEGEWGQGERYVVAAERERIGYLDTEIERLEKLQADCKEQLRAAEQNKRNLEQDRKLLEKQVYGLADLEFQEAPEASGEENGPAQEDKGV
ncbi:hypothetical protein QWJ34_06855 [Saccharibacillus sp. CPCC 101409]|uniref:hypothetical protein n=1 Tax=Saccharibacillus sp. CPCC 101409 TaxID=3058041 RepID=UPI002673690C|nr:hypothetical protein [Saccharibacillus sp. CPCC 101409]MDO3409477.1 hypothetical protein [Saccharibacillus sp. CPCC 101409]